MCVHQFMDSLQCEISDTGNQAVGETPTTSNDEMDEVQLQSRSEPQFKTPRTEAGSVTFVDVAFSTSTESSMPHSGISLPC